MLVLGAMVALALLWAALEYNASSLFGDDEAALLDEIAEEMEYMPPFEDNDPLPMPEERLSLSDQVVVDEEQTSTEEEEKAYHFDGMALEFVTDWRERLEPWIETDATIRPYTNAPAADDDGGSCGFGTCLPDDIMF